MKEEIDVIKSNETWELVDLPISSDAIGVKWIYRTVERYKVSLVAKGYSQHYGIGYYETFSPKARVKLYEWYYL